MAQWTAANIPSQDGKLAIVTGANSGLGFRTARGLAQAGATVVLACRDVYRAEDAKRRILAEAPRAKVETRTLDLASLGSTRKFADDFVAEGRLLDLLINNAAVMATPRRQTTADGFELQFGVNYLGHFALTGLLLPALMSAKAARIVTVASIAHKRGAISFDDLNLERSYRPWKAYSQSKLANLMFALELDRRLKQAGAPVMSVAAHPGVSRTSLVANSDPGRRSLVKLVMQLGVDWFAQSDSVGALPILFAATSPAAQAGAYYGPDGFREMRGYPVEVWPARQACDVSAAGRLWEAAEALTGVRWEIPPA
jgi:NAD(P)-dependent dehydrogenase (short-subunit alcohol dehydrogenase family)